MQFTIAYTATYIENEKVWRLHAPDGSFVADFCILNTGAYKGGVRMLSSRPPGVPREITILVEQGILASEKSLKP